MIAFHFPPCFGSSGSQRILNFCQYLPESGWDPTVLTVRGYVHRRRSYDQVDEIPVGTQVRRTMALDGARHLAFRGRYFRRLAMPDPWATWRFFALPAGRRLIREQRPDIIWSTFPIATAHVIAAKLHRESGIPWVADFRDNMTEADYPSDPIVRTVHRKLEREIVRDAKRIVLTTPGARELYTSRYSDEPEEKWCCIRNGYDERSFENIRVERTETANKPLHLVHSGLLYPNERNPSGFFEALSIMKRHGVVSSSNLRITLRSTGHDSFHTALLRRFNIGDIVVIEPGVPYADAIEEMCGADGLLIFQGSNCNNQIPAKLYEYFRARRPIFALTDPAGDTAKTMAQLGMTAIARIDNAADIQEKFERFLSQVHDGQALNTDATAITKFSRRAQAAELGVVLDKVMEAAE